VGGSVGASFDKMDFKRGVLFGEVGGEAAAGDAAADDDVVVVCGESRFSGCLQRSFWFVRDAVDFVLQRACWVFINPSVVSWIQLQLRLRISLHEIYFALVGMTDVSEHVRIG
jgi:hypothetical protein